MSSNAIYVCIDKNYEKYAKACFNSIEKNYPKHPIVLVYANDLTEEFTNFISSLNNFKIVKYSQSYANKNLGPVNKEMVYNKYRLWSNEFDEYDRVLHLDADTLVLRPLDTIFKEEFFIVDDCNKYSTQNILTPSSEVEELLKKDNIPIDIEKQFMANAGVFVISKKYRTEEHYKKLIYLSERYSSHLCYADQSVITMWCYMNSISISNRVTYNYQPPFFVFMPNNRHLETIAIIHFTAKKPDQINFLLWGVIPSQITKDLVDLYLQYK